MKGDFNRMRKFHSLFLLFLLVALLIGACRPAAPETAAPKEPVTLRIAVLPIMDTLPMLVAESEGLFAENGVQVEFVPVASAPERDQVLQAGRADGTVNETLSVMFFNKEKVQMQVVRFAHMATPESGHFFILASAQSGISDVDGLKGAEIGISQGTIIEYITDRLLTAQGFAPEDIKTVAVPKIPDRLALLGSGELQAAVLPDPLGALAEQQGAKIILDDRQYPTYGASVISFRKEVIDQHPEAIRAFLAAVEEAVTRINSEPERFTGLLSEKKLVPPPLLETYHIPTFPTAGVPSEADWNDVLSWAKEKGLLEADISYADSVTDAFLP
ncbi:MAG: metal ABC transporter substrate-binding protein [Anaerolineae bacterium]|nr:MAG: metal ABC transporter substrate-binding protein [Anaerolineae bacterium]